MIEHFLLDIDGIIENSDHNINLHLCNSYLKALCKSHISKIALANDLYLSNILNVLKNLINIKKSIISLNRAKA